eukprot:Hpha_TRINITY_DN5075_c0_g1::TRINITY_DN5075_c0_g1_i1::g.94133::m.94133
MPEPGDAGVREGWSRQRLSGVPPSVGVQLSGECIACCRVAGPQLRVKILLRLPGTLGLPEWRWCVLPLPSRLPERRGKEELVFGLSAHATGGALVLLLQTSHRLSVARLPVPLPT